MENLEWTLSGRKFDNWKKYDDEKLVYDGEPMITFVKAPYYENGKVKAVIKFDIAHEDAKDDYARNINLNVYQPMIGTHYLAVTDTAKGAIYNGKITFTIYEDFHTYGQIKPDVDRIINGAKLNRYVEYVSLGATEEGRNIHFAVLAKDKASVEKYLNETLPLMLSDPAKLQAKLKSGSMGDYKLPIWFGNIHPQEMPCVDGIINVLETLASEDTFSYNVYGRDHVDRTAEASGKHLKTDKLVETVTVDIDKL